LALDRAFLALQKLEAIANELESQRTNGIESSGVPQGDSDASEVEALKQAVRKLQAENGRLRALVKTAADRVDSAISRLEAQSVE